jgi:hypothetical protein
MERIDSVKKNKRMKVENIRVPQRESDTISASTDVSDCRYGNWTIWELRKLTADLGDAQ